MVELAIIKVEIVVEVEQKVEAELINVHSREFCDFSDHIMMWGWRGSGVKVEVGAERVNSREVTGNDGGSTATLLLRPDRAFSDRKSFLLTV